MNNTFPLLIVLSDITVVSSANAEYPPPAPKEADFAFPPPLTPDSDVEIIVPSNPPSTDVWALPPSV